MSTSLPETNLDATTADVTPPPKRQFVSLGERITHIGTYVGVDWFFNAAAGVGFAYWGDRTAMGQKYWSKPLSSAFNKILKPFIKDPEHLRASVAGGNMFMSIIVGGMMTIPPLLVLELNPVKTAITKFFDRMIYGNNTVDHDPKFQQSYRELQQAPTKDFWTGMLTRGISLAPLLGVILFAPTRKLANEFYFHPLAKITGKTAEAIGVRPAKLMELRPGQTTSDWQYIHDSLSMDFGLGPIYALFHGITYDMFAKNRDTQKKVKAVAREQARIEGRPYPDEAEATTAPELQTAEKSTALPAQPVAKITGAQHEQRLEAHKELAVS